LSSAEDFWRIALSDLNKSEIRKALRAKLAAITEQQRHAKSIAACGQLIRTPEFKAARTVMLYLSTPTEVETAPLALRCWQDGKTVVVPKVSWDQRRMLPVEITTLQTGITTTGPGIKEPISGKPIPTEYIDLVVVPGLGFTPTGHRIGRGMGFYDRFLAQSDFSGLSCGLAFDEQIIDTLPVLAHDMPLGMLVTDQSVRRFTPNLIKS